MKCTVSVITPAYNAAGLIRLAVGSLQAQTFQDWEMIIVDDCSTDNTGQVVEELAGLDNRIRLVRHSSNSGPAAARNTALAVAGGRYVAFLDSDDLWLPRKLELQVAFMTGEGAALSHTAYRRFQSDPARAGPVIAARAHFDYRTLLKNSGMACLTVMIDRERTGPFTMPVVRHEDYALWLSLLRRGLESRGLNLDLARYRVSESSVSSNKLRSAKWVWDIYRNNERLNIPYATWCLAHYATNALLKRRGE